MLAGYCTFISKVSRHRDRTSLEVMPIDAWESELAAAVDHYMLAYAKRITAKPDGAKHKTPPAADSAR